MLTGNGFKVVLCAAAWQFLMPMAMQAADARNPLNAALPWDQIGAKAGADYHGEGLSVAATNSGARLHCVFQRLDGEATSEGLWLVSTTTKQPADRFRVMATQVGRGTPCAPALPTDTNGGQRTAGPAMRLPVTGQVDVTGQTVRFTRAGLVEEYSVGMDGLRQDFVVPEKPAGDGPLRVQLAVSGARVQPAAYGMQLVLEKSGRKLAYSRLHATDANGKDLPARIEAEPNSALRTPYSAFRMAVVVNDAGAIYPVRIDPTFSDANWISMGGVPGTDGQVNAAVIDSSGNLYIGGSFTIAGNVIANNVAKWNGSGWLALGSGMEGQVSALAVSGGLLYAAGFLGAAGGTNPGYIARWNGSSWSELGSGMDGFVGALAVSGGTLYAGGAFTSAGGTAATNVAQWNGSSWSALGSGLNDRVEALAVSGGILYVGGSFTLAGGTNANYIAQWDGNTWSALGSGMDATMPLCLLWRCRGARCMLAAISRRLGAVTPFPSHNGTGTVGRLWAQAWEAPVL